MRPSFASRNVTYSESPAATDSGSAEAIVAFDDRVADELVYRAKRSGHVTSKMRFQSAQVAAYLDNGLWLRLAAGANQRMAELVTELQSLESYGVRFRERVDVNIAFLDLPAPVIDATAARKVEHAHADAAGMAALQRGEPIRGFRGAGERRAAH